MHADRAGLYGATVVIVLLAAATGPAVGLLPVPEGGFGAGEPPGSGTADVTVVASPDRAQLTAGDYGDVYYLSAPETDVRVANVTGKPYLTLSIDVDDVWVSRTTVHSLPAGQSGSRSLSLGRTPIEDLDVGGETLEGHLTITLHAAGETRTLHEEPIVVEVVE